MVIACNNKIKKIINIIDSNSEHTSMYAKWLHIDSRRYILRLGIEYKIVTYKIYISFLDSGRSVIDNINIDFLICVSVTVSSPDNLLEQPY